MSALKGKGLKVVNVGLRLFYEELKKQGVEAAHVQWRPPAGGDLEALELLKRLRKAKKPPSTEASEGKG